MQLVAVAVVAWSLPDDLSGPAGPALVARPRPPARERLWFVNLVNFMDGIDWMTVAEVVPVIAGARAVRLMGALPRAGDPRRTCAAGAMIGFAPFNRPVARLFLGDVGSLPIGLLLAWLLLALAGHGHLAAALLLPLYYLADATITLLRRLVRGERFWQRAPHPFLSARDRQRLFRAGGRSRMFSRSISCSQRLPAARILLRSWRIDVALPGARRSALVASCWLIFARPRSYVGCRSRAAGLAEFRHRVLEHGLDHLALLGRDGRFETREPAAEQIERRFVRPRRDDAGMPISVVGLLRRKQYFVAAARPAGCR